MWHNGTMVMNSPALTQTPGEKYLPAATQALAAYELPNCKLTFLQHSDTLTYRVRQPESAETYLLRLHIPVSSAMGSHGSEAAALRSELVWLEALNEETDLELQHPLRNQNGELVTTIRDEATETPIHATLLTWLDGEPYLRSLESAGTAHQIGMLLAKLHLHASAWQYPAGFTRPSRDAAYFWQMLAQLNPCVQQGRIQPQDYLELETAVQRLTENMCSLSQDAGCHGIMHADTHKGNMLYHQGRVRLIDFSFCAIGDYMFDLAIAMSDMRPELHQDFLAGYQSLRPLPANYPGTVEGFFIGMMVGTFVYLSARRETEAILVRKVPEIAQQYARRFNRGERFWFAGD
jgi:Ser/Thr protein kinase RdoA (MazF antagonist)